MPFAVHQGTLIHYEVEGEGPPLVLQHGFTRDLEVWRELGYIEELNKDYQVILIDARGHGDSDKPHAPEAYWPDLMANDVVVVLDDLGIQKAHYFGYSMGGLIGFALARVALTRLHSLILGGFGLYPTEAATQFSAQFLQIVESGAEKGMEAYGPILAQTPPEARDRFLANDPQALLAIQKAAGEWNSIILRNLDSFMLTITIPCLLYAGDGDPFYLSTKECAKHMPNATFVSLSGISHDQGFQRSDLVIPHVKKFLSAVGQD